MRATTITPATKDPRLGTLKQAAALMECNEKTIRRWMAAGLVDGYRCGPRLIRVDLDQLAKCRRPIPTATV
jgi:excisionase family DNA binding protein